MTLKITSINLFENTKAEIVNREIINAFGDVRTRFADWIYLLNSNTSACDENTHNMVKITFVFGCEQNIQTKGHVHPHPLWCPIESAWGDTKATGVVGGQFGCIHAALADDSHVCTAGCNEKGVSPRFCSLYLWKIPRDVSHMPSFFSNAQIWCVWCIECTLWLMQFRCYFDNKFPYSVTYFYDL